MQYSLSKSGKQQKSCIHTSTNKAYDQVTRKKEDTEYEMCGTFTAAALATQEMDYETIPN